MRRLGLWVELLVLFAGVPVVLSLLGVQLAGWVIPALLLMALYCTWLIRRDPQFNRRKLYALASLKAQWRGIVVRLLVGVALLTGVVLAVVPELFLSLVRASPLLWLLVMVVYPLLSVYPQEFIYRAFFFQRYKEILGEGMGIVLASGVAFSWAHVVFHNWQAPLLTLGGGWIFAWTYRRSGSLLCACLEHALWGNAIFTLGLGQYFYGGTLTFLGS